MCRNCGKSQIVAGNNVSCMNVQNFSKIENLASLSQNRNLGLPVPCRVGGFSFQAHSICPSATGPPVSAGEVSDIHIRPPGRKVELCGKMLGSAKCSPKRARRSEKALSAKIDARGCSCANRTTDAGPHWPASCSHRTQQFAVNGARNFSHAVRRDLASTTETWY